MTTATVEPTLTAPAPLIYVSWREDKREHRVALGEGRHLIGDSAFSRIRVGDGGNGMAAAVIATPQMVTLRCLSAKPPTFVHGRRLVPGEQILVGDILEATIGRTALVIAARTVSMHAAHLAAASPVPAETNLDQLRQSLSRQLLDQMNLHDVELARVDSPQVREVARLKLRKLVAELTGSLPPGVERDALEQQVYDEVMGLGPLEPLLADEAVTEIMVNRRDQIFVERQGKLQLSAATFSSDQALLNVIERIVSTVGRRIDTASPIVDARLIDGSRVNAVIPPLALNGPCLTIRRFAKTGVGVDQLVAWRSMTPEMAAFLRLVVLERKNILISGGTGSGKTTLLNALSSFIPEGERIVTIEDAAELQMQQAHVVRLETRPPNLEGVGAVAIRDLVKNALRMRPDRIIVGECRGAEALDMLQAMNTGHDGSMTTAHANSPEDMLRRIETMVMMAGMELPLRAIREQIVAALTIVVQQTRRKHGRRLVTEIAWIRGLCRETGAYDVVSLYRRDKRDDPLIERQQLAALWAAEELAGTPTDVGG